MIDMQDESYNRPKIYQNGQGIAFVYKIKGKKRLSNIGEITNE